MKQKEILDWFFWENDFLTLWEYSSVWSLLTFSRKELETFLEKWVSLEEAKELVWWQFYLKMVYEYNKNKFYEEVYKIREICDKYELNFNYFIDIEKIKNDSEKDSLRYQYKKKIYSWYIYLIKVNWKYKIWKTTNLKNRIKKYITENPDEIEVIHYFHCKNYNEKERELHKKFKSKNINREWFNLNDNDINFIKNLKDEK